MNTYILSTIVEEDFDYSELINILSGGYITEDVEVKSPNRNRNSEDDVIEYAPHPHADRPAPDFSGKIVFAHFTNDYVAYDGVSHIVVDEFKNTKAWNQGVAYAKGLGATHVVIMNDVTHINPHVLELAIAENPDVSIINISDGGVFVVNTAFDFAANEDYNFWFEDNNILNAAAQSGSYARPPLEEPQIKQLQIVTRQAEFDVAIKQDFATSGTEIPNLDGIV
jgi:hypothetical protein